MQQKLARNVMMLFCICYWNSWLFFALSTQLPICASQIKGLPKRVDCLLAFTRNVTLKLMTTRRFYDIHTYLCHDIFHCPGDQFTLSTTSPRYNARCDSTRYNDSIQIKASLTVEWLSSASPVFPTLGLIGQ